MIVLPTYPAPAQAQASLMDFGVFLTPPLGGPVQRVSRLGNRFSLSVTMPPLVNRDAGRVFVSRLIRGKTEGVRMLFPMLGFDPGNSGSPVVNGANQTGRILNIRGAAAGYVFQEGQFFSIFTGGRHHLVTADVDTTVGAGGTVALSISPIIRVAHADGDLLHVSTPSIEGFIMGESQSWEMSVEHHIGLNFAIVEAA